MKKSLRIHAIRIGLLVGIALFIELFVYNFGFFSTLSLSNEDVGSVYISDEGEYEITNLNTEVKNIHITINPEDINLRKTTIWVKIKAVDEGNANYYSLPKHVIVPGLSRSEYISLHLSGKAEKLKFTIETDREAQPVIENVEINVHKPMMFSFARFLVLFGILFAIYLFQPKSALYKCSYDRKKIWQKVILGCLCMVEIVSSYGMMRLNGSYMNPEWEWHTQYQELAEAFLEGNVSLDTTPPQALQEMENPYDNAERKRVMKEAGETSRWDVAYYQGKYYVYFGVVPVLLFYLPYRMITGAALDTYKVLLILLFLLLIFCMGLTKEIIKRWFPRISFGIFVLINIGIFAGCGAMYILKAPSFYLVPILSGAVFTIAGLYFWLKALDIKSNRCIYLLLGSLCMALVAGCRPQLLLCSFLAFPILGKCVFKDRTLFSKDSVKETIGFCLPYIVIAVLLMTYNYARFGSVTDFGANYNLTTNDMTKRGMNFSRIGLSLFMYFFQPAYWISEFPFIKSVDMVTNYMGRTISENMFGGLLINNPLLWFLPALCMVKDQLKKKGLYIVVMMLCAIGIIVAVLDAQVAGILPRYIADFGFMFFLSAGIVIFALCEKYKNAARLNLLVLISVAGVFVYNATIFFAEDVLAISDVNVSVFYRFYYGIQFWL